MKLDTAEIESRHVSLRRFLKGVPMAKTMSAKVLSVSRSCSRFSKRQLRFGGLRLNPNVKSKIAADRTSKRRRVGRTAFQAFAAMTWSGRRDELKEVRQQFKALSGEERQKYDCMSADARHAKHRGASGQVRPFGMTAAVVRHKAELRRKVAWWQKHRSSLSEVERVKGIYMDVVSSGAALGEAAQQAVREYKYDQRQRRERGEAEARTVASFREAQRASSLNKLLALAPSARAFKEHLIPSPWRTGMAFDFAPDSATQAEEILHFAKANRQSNLEHALEMDGAKRRSTITQGSRPPLPPESKSEKAATECRLAGVCLCSTEGKRLKSFCRQFLSKAISKLCPPAPDSRRRLAQGNVVIALLSGPLPPKGAAISNVRPPNCLEEPGKADLWLHIGLMYFSPFRPTFQHLLQFETNPQTAPPFF